jgi:uncharacterized OsmC-like protein
LASIEASFIGRQAITFTARGRTVDNVRAEAEDGGPVGFTSIELLLIALGNCSLGWLASREMMAEEPLDRVTATIEAEMADDPPRMVAVRSVIDLEVQDASLLERKDELEQMVCTCPVCNSLIAEKTIEVRMRVAAGA